MAQQGANRGAVTPPTASPPVPAPVLAPPVPQALAAAGVAAGAVGAAGLVGAAAAAEVALVASILASSLGAAAVTGLLLSALLRFGISRDAAKLAVQLAGRRPGWTGEITGLASREMAHDSVYYRAAYLLAAAERLMASMASTRSHAGGRIDGLRDALRQERRYWHQHLQALRHRMNAARQVDWAAQEWGPLLGWYLGPPLRHTPECVAAYRHNFRADRRPAIGWPGTVHPQCGCFAGAPFLNAGSVDAATRGMPPE